MAELILLKSNWAAQNHDILPLSFLLPLGWLKKFGPLGLTALGRHKNALRQAQILNPSGWGVIISHNLEFSSWFKDSTKTQIFLGYLDRAAAPTIFTDICGSCHSLDAVCGRSVSFSSRVADKTQITITISTFLDFNYRICNLQINHAGSG